MNLRTIPRAAVGGSLKLTRLPLQAATRLLPGQQRGLGSGARLAVDQADASARSLAGSLLGDAQMREEAQARRAAIRERRRALDLRRRAAQSTAQADEQVQERSEQARTRRRQADAQAGERRRGAQREKQRTKQAAASTERRRVKSSREVEEKVDKKIEQDAPKERLEALESLGKAQEQRDQALTERDEAERLGEAAAALKAGRKQD